MFMNDYNIKEYFVYIFLDPRKMSCVKTSICSFLFEPFYVGQGSKYRYKNHFMPSYLRKNCYKSNKIKNIMADGHEPLIVILSVDNQGSAINLERNLIKQIGTVIEKTGTLTNLTIPSEDNTCLTHTSETRNKIRKSSTGRKHSEETKKLLSNSKIGDKNPMFKTGEYCSKVKSGLSRSEAKLGKRNPMYGYKFSKDQIDNYRKASPKKKPIRAYNEEHEFLFESLAELCREMKLSNKCVRRVITGERKHHKGWNFEYI